MTDDELTNKLQEVIGPTIQRLKAEGQSAGIPKDELRSLLREIGIAAMEAWSKGEKLRRLRPLHDWADTIKQDTKERLRPHIARFAEAVKRAETNSKKMQVLADSLPEDAPSLFGESAQSFADRTGKVLKDVEVHRDGKTFKQKRWVNPDEPAATQPAATTNPKPGTTAQPSAASANTQAGRKAHIDELVRRADQVPAGIKERVRTWIADKYSALEAKYGAKGAKAVLVATVLMAPIPLPGTVLVPAALAEGVMRFVRLFKSRDERRMSESELRVGSLLAAAEELLRDLYAEFDEEPPEFDRDRAAAFLQSRPDADSNETFAEGCGCSGCRTSRTSADYFAGVECYLTPSGEVRCCSAATKTFTADAVGHEHKGKGPGGGQFVKKGGGGSAKEPDDKSPDRDPTRDEEREADRLRDQRRDTSAAIGELKAKTAERVKSKATRAAIGFRDVARRNRVLRGVRNESELATAIGGSNLNDSEPADVVLIVDPNGKTITDPKQVKDALKVRERAVKRLKSPDISGQEREHLRQILATPCAFLEVKTLITATASAVHMSKAALARKEKWVRRYAATFHTVAADDRRGKKHSGNRWYAVHGMGQTVRLDSMQPMENAAAVRTHIESHAETGKDEARRVSGVNFHEE